MYFCFSLQRRSQMKIVSSDQGKACSGVTCFDWQDSKWPVIVTNSSLISFLNSFLHEKGNLFELYVEIWRSLPILEILTKVLL